jgi:NAD+ synthase (glutamine-hydrolysing)
LFSSEATRSRAKKLADEVGAYHVDVAIDTIVSAFLSVLRALSGKLPRYKVPSKVFKVQKEYVQLT